MIPHAEPTTTGFVSRIDNHDTIILMEVHTGEETTVVVPFDKSPFDWLLAGEQCSLADLIGRNVTYDGEFLTLFDSRA